MTADDLKLCTAQALLLSRVGFKMKWLEDTSTRNLPNICRLCMAEGTDCMQKIFAECEHDGEKFQLSSRIIAVTTIKVEPGDHLPEQVCHHCVAQVNRWYDFKMLCENSDSVLRQQLSHSNSDIEIIMQLRDKEELPEVFQQASEIADKVTHTTSFLYSDGPNPNLGDNSEKEENGTLGRISTIFSLRQDISTETESLQSVQLLNGESYSINEEQLGAVTNGFGPPRPFLCTLCEARFSRKSQLKQHIAAHCGEPPHSCERCNAGFTLKSELIQHIHTDHQPQQKIHKIYRPKYSCTVCHSRFKTLQSVVHHQVEHMSVFRLQCMFCSKVFSTMLQLKFHLLHHHLKQGRKCKKCQRVFQSRKLFCQHKCPLNGKESKLQTMLSETTLQ